MSKEIELGELITLDDFHQDAILEGPGGPYVQWGQVESLIRERLVKAPIIEGNWIAAGPEWTMSGKGTRARLVLIEEIK